ncbi:DUF2065 domain-containing protein [Thalassomonas viridans]|uniref:DUF2065 domain-containing protein n=1 Tax=Thalassomonas viridans TaxID=137584 RepID=A0AAF0C9L0_9GAMM|nr:DUF2065 domain-containing protein [Thalassomonas viridans]WDE04964.1 DUF2065 domain-containing protein [Thalassomonas viridans]
MEILTLPGLLTVLAVVFIIEGLLPALFPNKWRAYIQQLASQPSATIRTIGLFMVFIGVVLLLLIRS